MVEIDLDKNKSTKKRKMERINENISTIKVELLRLSQSGQETLFISRFTPKPKS